MTQLLTGLRAADKAALLAELARHAAAALGRDGAEIGRRLAAREALGSTGTGGGHRGAACAAAGAGGTGRVFRAARPADRL